MRLHPRRRGSVEIVNGLVSQFGTGIEIAGRGETPNLIANNILKSEPTSQHPLPGAHSSLSALPSCARRCPSSRNCVHPAGC